MVKPLSPHNGDPVRAADRVVRSCAFTLVELLAVVGVVGLLVALAFGAAQGAQERSRRRHAEAELAVLAQALEAYRAHYGDFPATGAVAVDPEAEAVGGDGPGILFNCLVGRCGPGGAPLCGRSFVRLTAHVRQTDELPGPGAVVALANAFLDPWGRRYLYLHRTGPGWRARTPRLWSAGPDGVTVVPQDLAAWSGESFPDDSANADDLFAP